MENRMRITRFNVEVIPAAHGGRTKRGRSLFATHGILNVLLMRTVSVNTITLPNQSLLFEFHFLVSNCDIGEAGWGGFRGGLRPNAIKSRWCFANFSTMDSDRQIKACGGYKDHLTHTTDPTSFKCISATRGYVKLCMIMSMKQMKWSSDFAMKEDQSSLMCKLIHIDSSQWCHGRKSHTNPTHGSTQLYHIPCSGLYSAYTHVYKNIHDELIHWFTHTHTVYTSDYWE